MQRLNLDPPWSSLHRLSNQIRVVPRANNELVAVLDVSVFKWNLARFLLSNRILVSFKLWLTAPYQFLFGSVERLELAILWCLSGWEALIKDLVRDDRRLWLEHFRCLQQERRLACWRHVWLLVQRRRLWRKTFLSVLLWATIEDNQLLLLLWLSLYDEFHGCLLELLLLNPLKPYRILSIATRCRCLVLEDHCGWIHRWKWRALKPYWVRLLWLSIVNPTIALLWHRFLDLYI